MASLENPAFSLIVVRLEQDSYYYVLRREASDAHFSHPASENRPLASKRSFYIPTLSDKAM
jgi:hypothetical protein